MSAAPRWRAPGRLAATGRWRSLAAGLAATLTGCGLTVQSADLFLLTRTGQGTRLTLLVSDSGEVRCNGAPGRRLSDPLLIRARDLSDNLVKDASRQLSLPSPPGTVFAYRVRLQPGTIRFADRSGAGRPELAQTELLAALVAQQACGLAG